MLRFKTTINCGACIKAATPVLDQQLGAGNWQVDIFSPERTLTVYKKAATAAQVQAAVTAAGFESFPLN